MFWFCTNRTFIFRFRTCPNKTNHSNRKVYLSLSFNKRKQKFPNFYFFMAQLKESRKWDWASGVLKDLEDFKIILELEESGFNKLCI